MEFYVYENWTQKKAVIHRGNCGYCQFGKGKNPTDSGKHGRWLGGFETFDEAATASHNTGQPHRRCKVCDPL